MMASATAEHGDTAPTTTICVGIDIGTTSAKAAVVQITIPSSGRVEVQVLSSSTTPTKAYERCDVDLFAEQSVTKIVASVQHVLQEALQDVSLDTRRRIARVNITGQMHGVLLWQSNGGSSSRLVTWEDARCAQAELAQWNKCAERHALPHLASGHGMATLAWLAKHQPSQLAAFDCCGTIMDYVACMLTGKWRPVMDPSNAASFGLFHIDKGCWDLSCIKQLGIPERLLPAIGACGDVLGTIGQQGSSKYSLPANIAVGVPSGDNPCSVLCSMLRAGCTGSDAAVNVGTSAQLAVPIRASDVAQLCAHARLHGCHVEVRPYVAPNQRLLIAAPLTGGNVLAAFVSAAQGWLSEVGASTDISDMHQHLEGLAVEHRQRHGPSPARAFGCAKEAGTERRMCAEASRSAVSHEWPHMRPTFIGERHAPMLRGSLWNLTASNMSLAAMYQACAAGIANNLASMLTPCLLLQLGVSRLVASGGAVQRSAVLRDEIEASYGLPLLSSAHADAAVGAAMLGVPQCIAPPCRVSGSGGGVEDREEEEPEESEEEAGHHRIPTPEDTVVVAPRSTTTSPVVTALAVGVGVGLLVGVICSRKWR